MSRRASSGFTLLEIIAATLIVAILGAAALLVCRGLMRQAMPPKEARAQVTTVPAFVPRLRQTLERDLLEASDVYAGNNQVILEGPLPLRPDLGNRGHSPSQVVWKIERKDAGKPGGLPFASLQAPGLLIREQTEVLGGAPPRREVVLEGVDRLEIHETEAGRDITLSGPALPGSLRAEVSLHLSGQVQKKTDDKQGKERKP